MAVEDEFIELMVDDDTCLIQDKIPVVLDYLFENYGKMTSNEVKQLESDVLSLSFNPADPVVTIYRPIKQLQKKKTEAATPYLEAQLLELGLSPISNTRDFEKGLGEWNALTNKN